MQGPRICGPYRIERQVAAEGGTITWAAVDVNTGEPVILKIIRGFGDDEASLTRALRDLENAARLTHRNTAAVRCVGRAPPELHGGGVFFAIESLDGTVLQDVLRERRFLGAEEAIGLVRQVCDAVYAAHELGIVHGNLRPQNIVVVDDLASIDPLVKVCDFGMPLPVTAQTEGPGRRIDRRAPVYRAPEQVDGRAPDVRSDIYAIGALLDRMLTGKAWDLDDPRLDRSLRARAPERDIPAALDDVVMRCLALQPDDRFGSVELLSTALHAALLAPTKTVQPPGALPMSRDEGDLFAAAVSDATMPKLVVAPPPPPPKASWRAAAAAAVVVLLFIGAVFALTSSSDTPKLIAAKVTPLPPPKPTPIETPTPTTWTPSPWTPPTTTPATTTPATTTPATTTPATTPPATTTPATTNPATTTPATTATATATATTKPTTTTNTTTTKPTTVTSSTTTSSTTTSSTATTKNPKPAKKPATTNTTTTTTTTAEDDENVFEHVHTGGAP